VGENITFPTLYLFFANFFHVDVGEAIQNISAPSVVALFLTLIAFTLHQTFS
jgi:hypothetical protein